MLRDREHALIAEFGIHRDKRGISIVQSRLRRNVTWKSGSWLALQHSTSLAPKTATFKMLRKPLIIGRRCEIGTRDHRIQSLPCKTGLLLNQSLATLANAQPNLNHIYSSVIRKKLQHKYGALQNDRSERQIEMQRITCFQSRPRRDERGPPVFWRLVA